MTNEVEVDAHIIYDKTSGNMMLPIYRLNFRDKTDTEECLSHIPLIWGIQKHWVKTLCPI